MRNNSNPKSPSEDVRSTSVAALDEERQESDDGLRTEREIVDRTVYEVQHDSAVAPSVQSAMRDLRRRLRQQRKIIDTGRTGSRETTDAAIDRDQRSSTDDVTRAEAMTEGAEEMLHLEREDVHQSLWAILAELDLIASSVQAIQLRALDLPAGRDVGDLAGVIGVASDRVLALVGDMLDPEDSRSSYHDIGGSG
jgi:hypothetical protein